MFDGMAEFFGKPGYELRILESDGDVTRMFLVFPMVLPTLFTDLHGLSSCSFVALSVTVRADSGHVKEPSFSFPSSF